MTKSNAREQIVQKIKDFSNILIAVNDNPSVDELAAALSLTLALNKSGKHATAVASGQMPEALKFLNPDKTFETSVDSLRDFVIALSKDKADHLRYKLVDDHVKIFITPYKSIISEKDLEFEQGDFNVDLILALGVQDKQNLDAALRAHGRIFHDASAAVITAGEKSSKLTEINWHEENASGLSEMILELIESSAFDKKSLSKPVATALLAGIVSETERFSNEKVNAKVMSAASKLIAAGADQKLVISKIREAEEKATRVNIQDAKNSPQAEVSAKIEQGEKPQEAKTPAKPADATAFAIKREAEPTAEDELEASLNNLSAELSSGAKVNAFEDLAKEEFSTLNATDSLKNEADNFEAPTVSKEIIKETTPEIAPIAEIPAPEITPIVEAPKSIVPENFTPVELPTPEVAPIGEDFLTETPLPETTFEPAPLTEINLPEQAPITEPIAPVINAPAENLVAPTVPVIDPIFEAEKSVPLTNSLNFEAEPIAPIAPTPEEKEGGRKILPFSNDPNQAVGSNDAGVDFSTPAPAFEALAPAPMPTPEVAPVVETPAPAFEMPAPTPVEVPAPAFEAKPVETSKNNTGADFGIPPLPPMPNFDQMMPPEIPAVPDFGQLPELPNIPAPNFGAPMNTVPAPEAPSIPEINSAPQDPAQFRIPGM